MKTSFQIISATLAARAVPVVMAAGWSVAGLDAAPAAAPLKPVAAKASSQLGNYAPAKAIDGVVSDGSRWVSEKSADPAWLVVEFAEARDLAGVHLFTGYGDADPIADFKLQFWGDGGWRDIPSATVTGNRACALALPFDQTVAVRTDRLRLWVAASHLGTARVKELVVWPGAAGELPPLGGAQAPPVIVPLYLNQSGFNLGKPKRFTAPTLADGTGFVVRPAAGGPALHQGTIRGHVGDFSPFDPGDDRDYVVEAGGLVSVPFRVGRRWLERTTYQNAVDFMIDSRHYTGNDRAKCQGSYGWRDDHHFGWQLHTLVPQFCSNPSAYERMPRQIVYQKPADPALWGALEPYRGDAPDLVKLIHWGADVIVTQQLKHELLKSQLAYFLAAWPVLERWLPEQNYRVVRDYAFAHWAAPQADRTYPYDESPEHDLLALKTKVGTTKGAYPPGFSVEPNLLLHQVAVRERRPDAGIYLDAAARQAGWLVEHLDWNDPQTTKGQRMSEFLTITGLVHLLREFPAAAPPGLARKIDEWAAVAIRRSNNMWDFRKLDDRDKWTPMGEKPQMWNEPGNVVGLPAALLAAREVIRDETVRARLEVLAWSHFDNMSGRNPVGRHFSFDAPREIEGIEHGWFRFYPGGIGRLAEARFVLDGSPKDGHYPWHPEKGDIGWSEGWVQFNVAFNISLAYLAWSDTRVALARDGEHLTVRLSAPVTFDSAAAERATVVVAGGQGDVEEVVVTEEGPDAEWLSGRIRLAPGKAPARGDHALQFVPGTTVRASYGFGHLARHATLKP